MFVSNVPTYHQLSFNIKINLRKNCYNSSINQLTTWTMSTFTNLTNLFYSNTNYLNLKYIHFHEIFTSFNN